MPIQESPPEDHPPNQNLTDIPTQIEEETVMERQNATIKHQIRHSLQLQHPEPQQEIFKLVALEDLTRREEAMLIFLAHKLIFLSLIKNTIYSFMELSNS